MTTLMVAIGGVLGVVSRYGLTRLTLHTEALLLTTAAINLAGSFMLGVLVATDWFSRDLREGLGVGFLGGLTTFSTFSVQAVLEAEGGRTDVALIYVAVSVLGGIAGATAGYLLGRAVS